MYLILPLSLNMKFKRLYSISQIQNKVFNISFWLSPFTCVALLNISFSPAHYIFLEITLSLFTAILQAKSTKCQRDALVTAVTAPDGAQNEPGRSGKPANQTVATLPPWTVVHLHGGRTAAVSDGWTENGTLSGQYTTCNYTNDQQATLLWYHDHAMGITRFNVYTGLAGLYII